MSAPWKTVVAFAIVLLAVSFVVLPGGNDSTSQVAAPVEGDDVGSLMQLGSLTSHVHRSVQVDKSGPALAQKAEEGKRNGTAVATPLIAFVDAIVHYMEPVGSFVGIEGTLHHFTAAIAQAGFGSSFLVFIGVLFGVGAIFAVVFLALSRDKASAYADLDSSDKKRYSGGRPREKEPSQAQMPWNRQPSSSNGPSPPLSGLDVSRDQSFPTPNFPAPNEYKQQFAVPRSSEGSLNMPLSASRLPGGSTPQLQSLVPGSNPELVSSDPRLNTSAGPVPEGEPPPLCPTLVLPVCEARFAVAVHALADASKDFDVIGLSGTPLLRVAMRGHSASRSLEISMAHPGSTPRVTIRTKNEDMRPGASKSLEILGPQGTSYGDLVLQPSGAFFVIRDQRTVMIIDGDTVGLWLTVTSGEGRPLASVMCGGENFGGVEHLELHVNPGIDAVLVLSCVLAVVLMSPNMTDTQHVTQSM
eukprot:gnl/TRDRNA2_/TRDRNA2_182023_c0_seq1.p1 gnl/TRDRNA2_/TRDRNA2_182023_c0~~gnl/TRDRNA2_/TRDRNA2_182023_c0_seq1.p1  ORF type:complete len:470 (+),score=74.37 gnl/TRDRNA2_/TRDRNA2_182023_c0_seq1:131-1540(+)